MTPRDHGQPETEPVAPRAPALAPRASNEAGTADYWRAVADEYRALEKHCGCPEVQSVCTNLVAHCEDLATAASRQQPTPDIVRDENAARWRERERTYRSIAGRARNAERREAWTILARQCGAVAGHLESMG